MGNRGARFARTRRPRLAQKNSRGCRISLSLQIAYREQHQTRSRIQGLRARNRLSYGDPPIDRPAPEQIEPRFYQKLRLTECPHRLRKEAPRQTQHPQRASVAWREIPNDPNVCSIPQRPPHPLCCERPRSGFSGTTLSTRPRDAKMASLEDASKAAPNALLLRFSDGNASSTG